MLSDDIVSSHLTVKWYAHYVVDFLTLCTSAEGLWLICVDSFIFRGSVFFGFSCFFTSLLRGCRFPLSVVIQGNAPSDRSGASSSRCGVGFNVGC